MASIAQGYKDACTEHIASARELYVIGRYALSCYLSGLAVECILRAHRYQINPEFDSRHDLRVLFGSCGLLAKLKADEQIRCAGLMSKIALLWRNDHRFLSTGGLYRFLKDMRFDRRMKGDIVKEAARQLLTHATEFTNVGVEKWKPD